MTAVAMGRTAVLCVLGTLLAACGDGSSTGSAPPAPPPVPPAATPSAPPAVGSDGRPLDDRAVRALAEEVARLRAQLADLSKAKSEPAAPVAPPAAGGGHLVEALDREAPRGRPARTRSRLPNRRPRSSSARP